MSKAWFCSKRDNDTADGGESCTNRASSPALAWLFSFGFALGVLLLAGVATVPCMQQDRQLQEVKHPAAADGGTSSVASVGGSNNGYVVGDNGKIPAPIRTIDVSNDSQLLSALNSAEAGDHIVLADGSYSGFTVSKSGQDSKPIVLRSANLHGATFTGGIQISGDHIWLVGMDMWTNGIVVSGRNVRISRNYFKSSIGPAIFADKSSRNVEIDHNEHAGGMIISQASNGASPIYMRYECAEPSNHHVHHNYIHDGTGGDGKSEAIMSGFGTLCGEQGAHKPAPAAGTIVEYNLIANYKAGYCLRTKSSSNIFRFNTCIGVDAGSQNRVGSDNQWIANWFEGGRPVLIHDGHNTVVGNSLVDTSLRIASGSSEYLAPYSSGYVAATDVLVASNSGPLEIGRNFSRHSSVPSRNTRIEGHTGSITFDGHADTLQSPTTSRTVPQAFKLTPFQVGPNAPAAPKL